MQDLDNNKGIYVNKCACGYSIPCRNENKKG